jgi:hypothetical protein
VSPVYAEYGPLLLSTDVDRAIIGMVQLWLPTYLTNFEQERGLPNRTIKRPEISSYSSTLEDVEFPDRILPAVFITSSSTDATPEMDGDGNYYAAWHVVVSAITRGQNGQNTRDLASYYEGCIRRILLQQPLPMSGEIRWAATPTIARVTDRSGEGRYLAAGIGRYTAYVDHCVHAGLGPSIPNGPYPDPDPTQPDEPTVPLVPVTDVTYDVQAVPLDEGVSP